jgi:hypothetical protein
MAIRGNLSTMGISDILQFLENARKTGRLVVGRQNISKQIFCEQGRIVGSISNDPKEYFGQFLLHYGKVEESQLRSALEVHRQSRERLGRVLIKLGILSEQEVVEMLRLRALELVYELFLWDQAEFEFQDQVSVPEDLIRIEIRPALVVMEGMVRADEWRRYREQIPSDRVIFSLVPNADYSSLRSAEDLPKILWHVKKGKTIAEICCQIHASPFHVYSRLFELLSAGVVCVERELPSEPPTPRMEGEIEETSGAILAQVATQIEKGATSEALNNINRVLERNPTNFEAQRMFQAAEEEFTRQMYQSGITPESVPQLAVPVEVLSQYGLEPKEGFIISRIDGSWDVKSILSISPFREAESLRILKRLLDAGLVKFLP